MAWALTAQQNSHHWYLVEKNIMDFRAVLVARARTRTPTRCPSHQKKSASSFARRTLQWHSRFTRTAYLRSQRPLTTKYVYPILQLRFIKGLEVLAVMASSIPFKKQNNTSGRATVVCFPTVQLARHQLPKWWSELQMEAYPLPWPLLSPTSLSLAI